MQKEILGVIVRIFPTCKTSGYIGFDIFENKGDAGKPWKRVPNTTYIDCLDVSEALEKGEHFYIKFRKEKGDEI